MKKSQRYFVTGWGKSTVNYGQARESRGPTKDKYQGYGTDNIFTRFHFILKPGNYHKEKILLVSGNL